MNTRLKKALYESIMKNVSKLVKRSLNEYSEEGYNKASDAAKKLIKGLLKDFEASKFTDETILRKLQKRAYLVDAFAEAAVDSNKKLLALAKGKLNALIKKYADGIEIGYGLPKFVPIFYLMSLNNHASYIRGQATSFCDRESLSDRTHSYTIPSHSKKNWELCILMIEPNYSSMSVSELESLNIDVKDVKDIDQEIFNIRLQLIDEFKTLPFISFYGFTKTRGLGFSKDFLSKYPIMLRFPIDKPAAYVKDDEEGIDEKTRKSTSRCWSRNSDTDIYKDYLKKL